MLQLFVFGTVLSDSSGHQAESGAAPLSRAGRPRPALSRESAGPANAHRARSSNGRRYTGVTVPPLPRHPLPAQTRIRDSVQLPRLSRF